MTSPVTATYAVLYQAAIAPPIGGCYKPQKPNGYRDSSADIAYALQQRGHQVVTPVANPAPAMDSDWSFPDTAEGIAAARATGANTLWANTVLYATHPITKAIAEGVWIIGQEPAMAQRYDDKWVVHETLHQAMLPVPSTLKVGRTAEAPGSVAYGELTEASIAKRLGGFPVIVKPVRGRGSQGVQRVENLAELQVAIDRLISARSNFAGQSYPTFGDYVLVEEFLPGEECTVAVLPEGVYQPVENGDWLRSDSQITAGNRFLQGACPPFPTGCHHTLPGEPEVAQYLPLPQIRRWGHQTGVMPYSGDTPVVQNSGPMPFEKQHVEGIHVPCQQTAQLLGVRAVIRIDCRQNRRGIWCLFDINLKPNLTGSGRPGRAEQDSLVAMAAAAVGMNYPELIEQLIRFRWQGASGTVV